MIRTSDALDKLAPAFRAAQSEMTGVHKDRVNPHFKNRYATFENVCDTIRPVLAAHGLAWTQHPGDFDVARIAITTRIMHDSGQWMESTIWMPVAKVDPQGTGSAITYGLRYSLMAILGLPPTDDDDGEAATRSPAKAAAPKPVSKAMGRDAYQHWEKVIRDHTDIDALRVWWGQNSGELKKLPGDWYKNLYEECANHAERLKVMQGEPA